MKLNENTSGGGRVVPRGRTDAQTDVQTGLMKVIVAFHNVTNAPKHCYYLNEVLNKYISRCFPTRNGNTKSPLFPLCCHVFVQGEAHLLVT